MLSNNISGSGINPNPQISDMTDEEILSTLDWSWTSENKNLYKNAAKRLRELLSRLETAETILRDVLTSGNVKSCEKEIEGFLKVGE
jgi:hypothetical protein